MSAVEPVSERLQPTEDLYAVRKVRRRPAALARHAFRRRLRGRRSLSAGISLAALGGFLAFARLLHSRRANALDRAILRRVARVRGRWLNGVVRDVTSLGGIALVTSAVVTGLAMARRAPLSALQIALGGLGGAIGELALKRYVARPRPTNVKHLQDVTSFSFPSGHAIAASGVYLTLAMVGGRFARSHGQRVVLLTGAAAVATTVAASRVYLGVHHPSDVLAGLAFGTAWACLLDAGFEYVGARALDERALALRRYAGGSK